MEELRKANNDVSGDTLKAGQELVIPDMPILNDIEEIHQIDRNKYKKIVYRVKWGDNLYEIASRAFQDGKRWTVILDANKREIKDINDLPVGRAIIIPLTISETDRLKGGISW